MLKRTKITCAIAAGLLAVSGGIAYASIPDSDDGEFHGCVTTSGGGTLQLLYVIDKQGGVNCPAGYTEKVWKSAGAPYSLGKQITEVEATLPASEDPPDPNSGENGPGETVTINVACPAGKTAVYGDLLDDHFSGISSPAQLVQSVPDGADGWKVLARTSRQTDVDVTAYAVCVNK